MVKKQYLTMLTFFLLHELLCRKMKGEVGAQKSKFVKKWPKIGSYHTFH